MLFPGKHTKVDDNPPFKPLDMKLNQNMTPLPISTIPIHELDIATHALLTFMTKKNGVKGEVIAHQMIVHNPVGPVHDPFCPMLALGHCITFVPEPVAPPEAMQFGYALQRVLHQLANANPAYGPVYMGKFDLAGGFYRMPLAPKSSAPLAVLLPR